MRETMNRIMPRSRGICNSAAQGSGDSFLTWRILILNNNDQMAARAAGLEMVASGAVGGATPAQALAMLAMQMVPGYASQVMGVAEADTQVSASRR